MGDHNYNPDHIEAACETCLDFRLNWSMAAGELSAWKGFIALLKEEASRHFVADRDTEAHELKRLAKKFERENVEPVSKKLDEFIEGAHRA